MPINKRSSYLPIRELIITTSTGPTLKISYLSRETGEALQKAQQLDAEIVKYYTTIDSPNMNRLGH